MKRDMDLIRKILSAVEDCEHGFAPREMKIDGYNEEQIGYHNYLIVDSGLGVGADLTTNGSESPEYYLHHLTSAGHEFVEQARDDTKWNKAKEIVKDKGGGLSFELLKAVLIELGKHAVTIAASAAASAGS
jgi:uncharacterized protein DUF2513